MEFDEKGDFSRAIVYYLRVSEIYPESKFAPESLLRAARINRLYMGKTKEALKYLNEIILNYPNSEYKLQAQKEIADILMEDLKSYDRAINEYYKFIQMNPPREEILDARLRIARCFENQGNYDQALIEYQSLLDVAQNSVTPMREEVDFKISVIYYLKKETKRAISGFEEFLKKYPASEFKDDAKFYLASAYADLNEYEKALNLLQDIKGTYRNPDAVKAKIEGIEIRSKKIRKEAK